MVHVHPYLPLPILGVRVPHVGANYLYADP